MSTPMSHLRSIVDHDGAVILDFRNDSMLTLNPTAGYVWDKLQQGMSRDEIIRALAKETLADLAVVERDVNDFMEELKSRHLVTP